MTQRIGQKRKKREKAKLEKKISRLRNGVNPHFPRPEDLDYLDKVDIEELQREAQKGVTGRKLNEIEELCVLVNQQNDQIAILMKSEAELIKEIGALKEEIARLRAQELNTSSHSILKKVGIVPGQHLIPSDGGFCFAKGQAPEELSVMVGGGHLDGDAVDKDTGSPPEKGDEEEGEG